MWHNPADLHHWIDAIQTVAIIAIILGLAYLNLRDP